MKIYIVSQMIVDDYKGENALATPNVFKDRESAIQYVKDDIAIQYTEGNGYENLELEEDSYGTVTEFHGYFNGGMFEYRIDEVEL